MNQAKAGIAMSETPQTPAPPEAGANPLLKPWQTPFETPPFAEIEPEHFLPAFEQAFVDHAAEITAITHDPSMPDFANTITALERSGKLLSKVAAVFYDLVSAHSNPAILEIDKEVSLRMARHWNPIMMNAVLFGRIAMLHEKRATLGLTAEQLRLLERTYTNFYRAGAGLDEVAKKRRAEINERLAQLGTSFSHHLLGDEQDWFMELGEDDPAGLPDAFVAAAKADAEERGMAGKAIVTLSRSSVEPFLKSSSRRDLREKVFKAFTTRGDNGNANDNNATIVEILALREEAAKIMGFPTYAAYRLEDSMAKTPEAVRGLLERVWKPARARALADRDALQALIAEEGGNFTLAPWDWRYYAEILRQRRANFDDAAIKPYLVLDHMIEAAFDCATRLFGITFSERKGIPVWHPDVRVWEVKGRRRQAQGAVLWRLLRQALKALRRLDDLAARPAEARRRDRPADHQCLQLRQGRRRRAVAAVARRRAHAVPRVRPRPARHALQRDLSLAVGDVGVHRLRRTALPALRALAGAAAGAAAVRKTLPDRRAAAGRPAGSASSPPASSTRALPPWSSFPRR